MKRYKQANEGVRAPEELKEKAARPAGKRGHSRWVGAVAAALAVALIGGVALWPGQPGGGPMARTGGIERRGAPESGGVALAYTGHALAMADYPEVAPYPKDEDFYSGIGEDEGAWEKASRAYDQAYSAWLESTSALRTNTDYTGLMDEFMARSTAQFLGDAGEENRVYSPLNVYMALSMLAETTGGDTRQQILDLLQADSIETLRARAAALWKDHYRDDGVVTSLLANSLWLRDGMTYSQETLDRLASDYYASAFSGQMGSAEYDQALRDWINEQTKGLLAEQANGLEMSPATVLALASTIYFKAAWDSEFNKNLTETDVFHTPGGDVDADFMRQTLESRYCWGDNFTAVQLSFQRGGAMWLLLPDEGYGLDGLLKSGEAMDFLLSDKNDVYDDKGSVVREGWTGQKYLTINLSMPKFDVSSDLNLVEGLRALGITDVFDMGTANFDPLGAGASDPIYLSQAQHAARVKVDEDGCEAAAYTVLIAECGGAMPPDDEVDFVLDRPFLFAVTSECGLPLFVGAVNQPNG